MIFNRQLQYMSIQVVTSRLVVDTTDLERSIELSKELAVELGVSEKEASELTNEFQKQVKSVDQLTKEERELVRQRNKSTDPNRS